MMRIYMLLLATLLTAVAGSVSAPAEATPVFLAGWDLDAIAPRTTEGGFVSLTSCTMLPGEAAPACGSAYENPTNPAPILGYLAGGRPTSDFRASPVNGDPMGAGDLWDDGHSIVAGLEAKLQLQGLPEGVFELWLLSFGPDGERTTVSVFDSQGLAGMATLDPVGGMLFDTQVAKIPIVVDASGIVEIRYAAGPISALGMLNGVLLVPEPVTAMLLTLALLGVWRRSQ
jgi:hypothetical protein